MGAKRNFGRALAPYTSVEYKRGVAVTVLYPLLEMKLYIAFESLLSPLRLVIVSSLSYLVSENF